ncbi:MAG: hypothetical protein KatS3mg082_0674 [Nitrospiraceae bacterium]|nr:MAG: hypothetical protein KatS3mg082_0674 [Nitrospiraceae bacterium]
MKITQDVREYAAKKHLDEQQAIQIGMKEESGRIQKIRLRNLPLSLARGERREARGYRSEVGLSPIAHRL